MSENFSAEGLKKFFFRYKKAILAVTVLLCVALLLLPTSEKKEEDSVKTEAMSEADYVSSLEKRLETLLSQIDGVGKCRVMITLRSSEEKIYAADVEKKGDNTSTSHIKIKTDGDETTVTEKRYLPEIEGVAVVCDGAGSVNIKTAVADTVCRLLGIEGTSVSVSKRK